MACIKNNDLNGLTNILAEACPIGDDQTESGSTKNAFPLPDEHWINAHFGVEEKYRTLLEVAVELGQIDSVKALLRAGARADLHNETTGESPIHMAVEHAGIGIVKLLLEYMSNKPLLNKADINAVNRSGQTPLHLAALRNKADILRFLARCPDLDDIDPRDLLGGQTPLYLAARNGHYEIAETLIAHGADTSLRMAGGRVVRSVIAEHLPHLDPTKVKMVEVQRNKSGGSMMKGGWDRGDHLSRLLDRAQMNVRKGLSNSYNALEFKIHLSQLGKKELDTYDAAGMTLFQKAASFGLHLHVENMLDHGMDPNAVSAECSSKPVLLAAYNGYHKVLETLKNHKANSSGDDPVVCFSDLEKGSKESVLHWALKKSNPNPRDPNVDYEASFNSIMEEGDPIFNLEVNRIVNHKDEQSNSPLHYATQLWNQSVVRTLLERGGNIGIRNLWDETPVALIMPETMESFLNDFCLRSKKEVTHEDFELEFNYSFLAPPVDDPKYDETDPEGQEMVENAALPETESLWYMSQSKQHRHLLNHPVIMSFLWLKWQRIRGYFNRNLRFYLMFVMCLSWYIFERFGGIHSRSTEVTELGSSLADNASFCSSLSSRRENGYGFWYSAFAAHAIIQAVLILRDWRYDCLNCNMRTCVQICFTGWIEVLTAILIAGLLIFKTSALWTSLTILMAFLMLRELFQMSVSLKRYFVSPENWLELAMIAIVGVIMWVPDSAFNNPCGIKRHLAAVAIILSWAELITLVARHPRLSRYNVYVTMFYKVMRTFLLFLVWYSFFIVAFALGFYIMLHKDVNPVNDDVINNDNEDDYPFFNSPWLALVKTATMFVGEIEFSGRAHPPGDGHHAPWVTSS